MTQEAERTKLLSIGEALIDFIPGQTGRALMDVEDFSPKVGGGPTNAAGAFARLGGHAALLTKLGQDPFGDKIVAELAAYGVDVRLVRRTAEANTMLAFVSLMADGQREFSFYRNPSADMLYAPGDVPDAAFADAFALHFTSVSLGFCPMGEAHAHAVAAMRAAGSIVSFDPNVRLSLWPDAEALRRRILEFLPLSHILKISDEELEFVTGKTGIIDALPALFTGDVRLVLFTRGASGAEAYASGGAQASVAARPVAAIDTTGAGDAFIGSSLYWLAQRSVEQDDLGGLSADELAELLAYANDYCGYSVQRNGAIASYATSPEFAAYRAALSE